MNIVEILSLVSVALWVPVTILSVSVIKIWIEFKAMQKSTHQVTYIDPFKDIKKDSEGYETIDEDLKKKLQEEPFDNV